jgi:hypothetical protein
MYEKLDLRENPRSIITTYFPELIINYEDVLRKSNIAWSVEKIKIKYDLKILAKKTSNEGDFHRALKMAVSKWFPDSEFEYGYFDVSSKLKGIAVQVGDHWGSKLFAEMTEIPEEFNELWWLSYPDKDDVFSLTKFYFPKLSKERRI